ncbi:unnamed protein product [Owenia fusiformis]|uniref:Uncharacterized protein n=1 Tax=Owenia fusiformis TaxID=6347 RepID=A0A8S4MZN4_OWEFU|nr:unnamed protein product [Owenia fusiformis]
MDRNKYIPLEDTTVKVTLPERYKPKNQRLNGMNGVIHASNDMTDDDSVTKRLEDMATAVQWIKQEIMAIKRQDRDLLRQFLGIRADMRQMSASNAPTPPGGAKLSKSGSWTRNAWLEAKSPPRSPSALNSNSSFDLGEFRPRTTSLLEPPHHNYHRTSKWKYAENNNINLADSFG